MKAAHEDTIEFEAANDDDAGRVLHETLRKQIMAWVRQSGGDENRSRQIWAATWEGLQNAIRYGSDPGDPIRISLCRDRMASEFALLSPNLGPGQSISLRKSGIGRPRKTAKCGSAA